jgi:hypothetical protein
MIRLVLRIILVLSATLMVMNARPAAAQETLSIHVDRKATLIDGGQAVDLRVTVTCPAGATVLEAFLYVVQDGNQSNFAPLQPVCDGTAHAFTVRVHAADSPLRGGKAQVSGYLLLASGEATSPTGVVKLRP